MEETTHAVATSCTNGETRNDSLLIEYETPSYSGLEGYTDNNGTPRKSHQIADIRKVVQCKIEGLLDSSKETFSKVTENIQTKLRGIRKTSKEGHTIDNESVTRDTSPVTGDVPPVTDSLSLGCSIQNIDNTAEVTGESGKQSQLHPFKEKVCECVKKTQAKLTHTKEKLISKVKQLKDNHCSTKGSSDSKIFVTRSSIDFARIKADEKFIDQQPRAHPIIGACVIAFPYAFKQAGLPMGVILLLVISIMVEYSEVLLIQCSVLATDTSLQSISKTLFGTAGHIISHVVPYTYSLSVLLTYNVILGDICTKFFNTLLQAFNSPFTMNRKLTLFLLSGIIIPISMTTNVKRMFKWSLVSLISATFVTVVVSIRLFTLSPDIPPIYNAFKFLNTNILQSIGVMCFALSCQHTCRLYYATIDQSKEFNPNKPANVASSYSLLCTVVVGVFGYLTFKSVTQGNVLENYCEEDILATFARISFAAFTLCLFPMECQSLRHLIQQSVVVHKEFQSVFHYAMTLIILLPAIIAGMLVDCLSVVLETAGFVLAIPLVFILPHIFYVQLSPGKVYSKEKLPCLISIATGTTISLCGLTTTLFSSHYCVHQSKMFPYCNGSNELLGPLITLLSLNGTTNFDPQILGFNVSNFDSEFDNVTDIAHAYFTT